MKKNKIKKVVLIIEILISCVLTGCGKNNTTRLGTGGTGGNYYQIGMELKNAMDGEFSIDIKSTAGSVANIRLLNENYLDAAIVQSDLFEDAQNGTGYFAGYGSIDGIKEEAVLYKEACQIVVRADSNIKDVSDLIGQKVSLGEEGSGVNKNAMEILGSFGIVEDDLVSSYDSFDTAAHKLNNGELDAFFITAGISVPVLHALSSEQDIRILSFSEKDILQMQRMYTGYTKVDIPAGTYKGQLETINTVGVDAILVSGSSANPEAISAITAYFEKKKDTDSFILPESQTYTWIEDEDFVPVKSFDMFQTLAIAVGVLFLGSFLRKRINILETFCIPAPVVGGLIFAIISCVLYSLGSVEFSFDETLRTVCMLVFFTSVGFQADFQTLKSGGWSLVIFLGCVLALIFAQNTVAVGLSKLIGLNPLMGLCTGSIPMLGGHGTAGAFGPVLDDLGITGASSLCTAAATFGLIAGSLFGGPIGRRLILKHDLLKTAKNAENSTPVKKDKRQVDLDGYAPAVYQIAIAMGIGTTISTLLSKTGMTFPIYIGAMIVAAIMRNLEKLSPKVHIHMDEISSLGEICLSIFLGIAMITLKLWQLAQLAVPLFVLLLGQTVLIFLFTYFIVFRVMGKDYDAAVLCAGTCGFGMGATPNAMANMQALTEKFLPSIKAYILVPIVGSMFADFINSIVITLFINFY